MDLVLLLMHGFALISGEDGRSMHVNAFTEKL